MQNLQLLLQQPIFRALQLNSSAAEPRTQLLVKLALLLHQAQIMLKHKQVTTNPLRLRLTLFQHKEKYLYNYISV